MDWMRICCEQCNVDTVILIVSQKKKLQFKCLNNTPSIGLFEKTTSNPSHDNILNAKITSPKCNLDFKVVNIRRSQFFSSVFNC